MTDNDVAIVNARFLQDRVKNCQETVSRIRNWKTEFSNTLGQSIQNPNKTIPDGSD